MSILHWFRNKKKEKRTSLIPVAAFTAAYLALATPISYVRGNTEFLFYIAIVIAVSVVVVLIHRRVNFSQTALMLLSVWGLIHMLGGLVYVPAHWITDNNSGVLYSWWLIPYYLKYDNVAHAYGFFVATWVTWECVRTIPGLRKPTVAVLTLCWLAGMGLGSLNEILEFIAVLTIPNTNVGGYINTGWDLVANAIGALVAVTVVKLSYRE